METASDLERAPLPADQVEPHGIMRVAAMVIN
jgi:hypothetical protein